MSALYSRVGLPSQPGSELNPTPGLALGWAIFHEAVQAAWEQPAGGNAPKS